MYSALLIIFILVNRTWSLPDVDKWDYNLTLEDNNLFISKSLFAGSQIFIKVNCEANQDTNITINWAVVQLMCWDFSEFISLARDLLTSNQTVNAWNSYRFTDKTYRCNDHIILAETKKGPVFVTQRDGVYVLVLQAGNAISSFNLGVHVEMKNSYGYLSAADGPLLPFYGFMYILYVLFNFFGGFGYLLNISNL